MHPQTAAAYAQDKLRFQSRLSELGLSDLKGYFWYHTVDLGNGLVTPGIHDHRDTAALYGCSDDVRSKTVLDVGSATGFFAFEFERLGAHVTSVEIPSLDRLDHFPGQGVEHATKKLQAELHGLTGDRASAEELYEQLLDGPFTFCHDRLGSTVLRKYCTIYELSLDALQVSKPFDMVFLGEILWHTINPLQALAAAAAVCADTLIVAQQMPQLPDEIPGMVYTGGRDPDSTDLAWWQPTRECFIDVLYKLGFSDVRVRSEPVAVLRPAEYSFRETVLEARR